MGEPNIVQDGVDAFRNAFESIEDEVERVQKQLRARRKSVEKQLNASRKDFEKRTRKLRSEIQKSSPAEQLETWRKDATKRIEKLEKSKPAKQVETWRKDATKQFEQGVGNVLSTLQIASKTDVQRIDRKISQLNRKLKEMERAKSSAAKSTATSA